MNAQATTAGITRPRLRNRSWFLLALIALAIAFAPLPMGSGVAGSRELRLTAGQYSFNPGVIRVDRGDRVTIELVSTDVVHGLYVDGYEMEITADPGQTARLSFIADKPGTFRFRCSETCGPLHPFMIGKLKVGSNTLLWRGTALALLAVVVGLWGARRR